MPSVVTRAGIIERPGCEGLYQVGVKFAGAGSQDLEAIRKYVTHLIRIGC